MNKTQLVEAVAATMGRRHAATAVEAVLDAITRAVAAGDKVSVTGFGTFERKPAPARMARNPQTGDPVPVPAFNRVRFRPGQNLIDLANGKPLPESGSAVAKAPRGSLSGGAR